MRKVWNKGKTKYTCPSVRKISQTMQQKSIDNFKEWRDIEKQRGKFKQYSLQENGDLAELLGHVWGDGHISVFPRTECLRIVVPSKRPELVSYTASLITKVFKKSPSIQKRKDSHCVNVTLYQKNISSRLGVPAGSCISHTYILPEWIQASAIYTKRLLKGLYETDGAHCIHLPTHTYKLVFRNANTSLLLIVKNTLERLGFHPHVSYRAVQLSRKQEVAKALKMMHFREY